MLEINQALKTSVHLQEQLRDLLVWGLDVYQSVKLVTLKSPHILTDPSGLGIVTIGVAQSLYLTLSMTPSCCKHMRSFSIASGSAYSEVCARQILALHLV